MDIAKLSMNMAEAELTRGVQTGMLKKAMEQMEQTGAQIAEMIDAANVIDKSVIDIKI